MKEFDPAAYKKMVKFFQDRNDPTGWFDSILVSCRSRLKGEQEDDIPLPLDKEEIDGFIRCGLSEKSFDAYEDTQDPPVPLFFACYQKRVSRSRQNHDIRSFN